MANNTKLLIWKNLKNNSVVSYSSQLPLVSPDLYEVGPSRVVYDNETFTEARPWYLAVDPAEDSSFTVNQSTMYNGSKIQADGGYSMSSRETDFNVWIDDDGAQITQTSCDDGTADFECVSSSVVADGCSGTITGGAADCSWFIDTCKNRETFSLRWIVRACSGNEIIPSENILITGGSPSTDVSFDISRNVNITILENPV